MVDSAEPDDLDLLFKPNISINGAIDEATFAHFLSQLSAVRANGQHLIMELNTVGGDADVARRIALEVRLFSAHSGRSAFCIGKSYVYSAGVTIFAAFKKPNRFLTEDAVLLIHERRQTKNLNVSGPMSSCIQIVKEELSTLEIALRLEKEGFEEFVEGSKVSVEALFERAKANCYMTAQEIFGQGLIAKVVH